MKLEKSEYSHPSTTLVITEIFASRNVKKPSLCLQYSNSCHDRTCERVEKLGDLCFPSLHFLLLPDIPLNSVPRPFLLLLWFSCQVVSDSVMGFPRQEQLEWVAIFYSRRSSRPQDRTRVSYIAGRFFTTESPGEPFSYYKTHFIIRCYWMRNRKSKLPQTFKWEMSKLCVCVCVCVCVCMS